MAEVSGPRGSRQGNAGFRKRQGKLRRGEREPTLAEASVDAERLLDRATVGRRTGAFTRPVSLDVRVDSPASIKRVRSVPSRGSQSGSSDFWGSQPATGDRERPPDLPQARGSFHLLFLCLRSPGLPWIPT